MYWDLDDKGLTYRTIDVPEEHRGVVSRYRKLLIDSIIELDKKKTMLYLGHGELDNDSLISLIRLATISGRGFPVICGSAFKNKAMQPGLDAIVNYLPSPDDLCPIGDSLSSSNLFLRFPNNTEPTSMLIFKIMSDVYSVLLSFVRIYSGRIKQGGVVHNVRNNMEERITKLLRMHTNLRTELNHASFGDIVSICGIKHSITGEHTMWSKFCNIIASNQVSISCY